VKWSWKIATIAGIDIYVHGTYVLLLGFVLLSEWRGSRSLAAAASGALFMLAIFGTVVLHELGHALAARRFGIKTRDITLLPIGGIARLERTPDIPRQELWVALAGPAVNLVLAGIAYGLYGLVEHTNPILGFGAPGRGLAEEFISVNLALACFNLLPAFPMDGGRALRAILAERMDYVRATELAAQLGQGLALVLGFIGMFANPILVFIALFVWMGASSEASTVTLRGALAGIPVGRAMVTDFKTLAAGQPLREAARLVLSGSQRDFPVLDGKAVVGILTRDVLVSALAADGLDRLVGQTMAGTFETADPREMLESALARLQAGKCPVMPVVRDGELVGLLTPENIGELLMIRGALRRPASSRQGPRD
jgi:Zn-dependent protease/CBS domain-containing protein